MKKMLFAVLAILAAITFNACGEPPKKLTKQEKYLIIGKAKEAVTISNLQSGQFKEGNEKTEKLMRENLPKEVIAGYEKTTGKKFTVLMSDDDYKKIARYFEQLTKNKYNFNVSDAEKKETEDGKEALNRYNKHIGKIIKTIEEEYVIYKAMQEGVEEDFARQALHDPIQLKEIEIEFSHYVRGGSR